MSEKNNAVKKAMAGQRIDARQAIEIFGSCDLTELGAIADSIRRRLHPGNMVTYVSDRNINYTNICESKCRFCAFYKSPEDPEAYVITSESLGEKIRETMELGGTQILLQGGMNPDLGMDYYESLLREIKSEYGIHVHGFSPPEIDYLSRKSGLTIEETIKRLMDAGLDSIPGGGAEILVDRVRTEVSPNKCSSGAWLHVMEKAHEAGLKTTATMMFGHMETTGELVEHMIKIRDLQDRTNGFTAFIPWTFQPGNTDISVPSLTSHEYLKVLALSRIVLDNIKNIQVSWVTQGEKIAQTALFFGANDFGSTMIEENVVAAAGVSFRLPESEIVRQIESAGFVAAKRDCFYKVI